MQVLTSSIRARHCPASCRKFGAHVELASISPHSRAAAVLFHARQSSIFARPKIKASEIAARLQYLLNNEWCPVTELAFVRHGNTDPAPKGGMDQDRKLSQNGERQCAAVGGEDGWLSYLTEYAPPRGCVLTSPVERCRRTGELILGRTQPNGDDWQWIELDSIYDGMLQPEGSALFAKVGYAPLQDYHAADPAAERFLRRYGLKMLHDVVVELERDALLYPIVNEKKGEVGNSLVVFGHAVYSSAAALPPSPLDPVDAGGHGVLPPRHLHSHLLDPFRPLVLDP